MHYPRCLIAGLSGGTGKTLVSLGIVRALTLAGQKVKTFKKGPDYIDSAWLSAAAETPKGNLDPFFCDKNQLLHLFTNAACHHDISIIEGNRGLFDGLDINGSCSSAELARTLSTPVILVVNCTKMTRTVAALVQGCINFEPDLTIGGIILNHTGSERQRSLIRSAVEYHCDVPVIGAIPRHGAAHIEERHMGLPSTGTRANYMPILDRLASFLTEHLDLEKVKKVAASAKTLPTCCPELEASTVTSRFPSSNASKNMSKPTIGYVLDDAFWFYYQENLDALTKAGAKLVPVSLLDDQEFPKLDGLYIAGSLPDEFAAKLSGNHKKLKAIAALAEENLPIYAECGGLAYLAKSLAVGEQIYPMAGVFDLSLSMTKHAQGLGYVEAEVMEDNPFHPKGLKFKAHEFHFSTYSLADSLQPLLQLSRGKGMGKLAKQQVDGLCKKNSFASTLHIYAPALPHWANNFVQLCQAYQKTAP